MFAMPCAMSSVAVVLVTNELVRHTGAQQRLNGGQQGDDKGRVGQVKDLRNAADCRDVGHGEELRDGVDPVVTADGLDPSHHSQPNGGQQRPNHDGHHVWRHHVAPGLGPNEVRAQAGQRQGQGGQVNAIQVTAQVHHLRAHEVAGSPE